MFEAALEALSIVLDPSRLMFMLLGVSVGLIVGILPGLGASVGSFMSYGATARMSKTPERFGKGAIEGVAASQYRLTVA